MGLVYSVMNPKFLLDRLRQTVQSQLSSDNLSFVVKNPLFAYAKTKEQDRFFVFVK